jgi:hypothetical protein
VTNQTSQNKKAHNERTMIFCEFCNYKRIIEIGEKIADMPESKTSDIQIKIPQLDPITGKTIPSKFVPQPKRYKCPKCGRAAKVRELIKPLADAFKLVDEAKIQRQLEEEKKKRLEDGKPPDKKVDPDFMG